MVFHIVTLSILLHLHIGAISSQFMQPPGHFFHPGAQIPMMQMTNGSPGMTPHMQMPNQASMQMQIPNPASMMQMPNPASMIQMPNGPPPMIPHLPRLPGMPGMPPPMHPPMHLPMSMSMGGGRLPMVVMPHYSKKADPKPRRKKRKPKRKRINMDSSSSEDSCSESEFEYRSKSKLRSAKKRREVLTPVVSYVTKDGYVVYQKKIKKDKAKDWLELAKNESGDKDKKKNEH